MIKFLVFCLTVYSAVALLDKDKCSKDNEKLGLVDKLCDDKKFDFKKELSCVCDLLYYRNADGECVKKDDCGQINEPTEKQYSYCPEGYELVLVSCHRHGGSYGGYGGYYDGHDGYYGGHGGYDGYDKKCKICKKKY